MHNDCLKLAGLALILFWTGCGDVCDQAASIIEDCNLQGGQMMQPPPTEPAVEQACEGEAKRTAQCTVDHRDVVCAYFKDLTTSNAYGQCLSGGGAGAVSSFAGE